MEEHVGESTADVEEEVADVEEEVSRERDHYYSIILLYHYRKVIQGSQV